MWQKKWRRRRSGEYNQNRYNHTPPPVNLGRDVTLVRQALFEWATMRLIRRVKPILIFVLLMLAGHARAQAPSAPVAGTSASVTASKLELNAKIATAREQVQNDRAQLKQARNAL